MLPILLWPSQRRVCSIPAPSIDKRATRAIELNVKLDSFIGDAFEHKFETAHFDLVVLFYFLDRALFAQIISALKPGGFLLGKMSLRWASKVRTPTRFDPLNRDELPSLVPELKVLYHRERPARAGVSSIL